MNNNKYTRWLNKEVQISLVSVNNHVKKDVKETETSKLKNQNEIKEENTCDNVIVIDEDNDDFPLQSNSNTIYQKNNTTENQKSIATTKQSILSNTNNESQHSRKTKQNPSDQITVECNQKIDKEINNVVTHITQETNKDNFKSALLNSPEQILNGDNVKYEVDEVDDNYIFKSIITVEEDSLTSILPNYENPYICCGISFFDTSQIESHKKLHNQRKSRQYRNQLLSLNTFSVKQFKKKKKSSQCSTQQLPLPNTLNSISNEQIDKECSSNCCSNCQQLSFSNSIASTSSGNFNKQNKCVQCNNHQLPSSGPIHFTVNKEFNFQNNSNQSDKKQFLCANTTNVTCNENYEQRNSNQGSVQQLYSDTVDLTADDKGNDQNKLIKYDTCQLSSSDSIQINVNEEFNNQNNSNQCGVQQLRSDTLDLTADKHCDAQNKLIQYDTCQISPSDPIQINANEEFNNQNNSNQCDADQLHYDSTSLTSNEQTNSNKCGVQQLHSDTLDLTADKNCDVQNKLIQCDTCQVSPSHPIQINANEEFNNQNNSDQCDTDQLYYDSTSLTCNKQINSYKCGVKQLHSDTLDLTGDKNCDVQNKLIQYDICQMSPSDLIQINANEEFNNQNNSDQCNTEQFFCSKTDFTINKRGDNHNILVQCDDTHQSSSSDPIHFTANKKLNDTNNSNQYDTEDLLCSETTNFTCNKKYNKQKTIDPGNTHQLFSSKTLDLTLDKKCDKRSKFNQYNTKKLSFSDTTNLTNKIICDKQNQFVYCDDSQQTPIFDETNSTCNKTYDKQMKSYKYNTCELSHSNKLIIKISRTVCKPKNKLYKCKNCKLLFSSKSEWINHQKSHKQIKSYTCSFCNKAFLTQQNLTFHLKTHFVNNKYKCNVCKQLFSKKSFLMNHMQTHTDYKPFKCDKCKISFNQKSLLLFHYRSHIFRSSNDCYLCLKKFTYESSLKKHLVMHSKTIFFQCNNCKICFNKKSNLILHMKTHMERKSHVCDVCKMTFPKSSNLLKHMKTHKNNRRSQRLICKRKLETSLLCRV